MNARSAEYLSAKKEPLRRKDTFGKDYAAGSAITQFALLAHLSLPCILGLIIQKESAWPASLTTWRSTLTIRTSRGTGKVFALRSKGTNESLWKATRTRWKGKEENLKKESKICIMRFQGWVLNSSKEKLWWWRLTCKQALKRTKTIRRNMRKVSQLPSISMRWSNLKLKATDSSLSWPNWKIVPSPSKLQTKVDVLRAAAYFKKLLWKERVYLREEFLV